MNKKVVVGVAVSAVLLCTLFIGIATVDWTDFTTNEAPEELPVFPGTPGEDDSIWDENEQLREESLAYTIFEKYGVVLLPLAILMFGAMVGGVCIAREEVEKDDSN